jgi:hypothetical protein
MRFGSDGTHATKAPTVPHTSAAHTVEHKNVVFINSTRYPYINSRERAIASRGVFPSFTSTGPATAKSRSLINPKYGIGTVMSEFHATDASRRKSNTHNDAKTPLASFNSPCAALTDHPIEFTVASAPRRSERASPSFSPSRRNTHVRAYCAHANFHAATPSANAAATIGTSCALNSASANVPPRFTLCAHAPATSASVSARPVRARVRASVAAVAPIAVASASSSRVARVVVVVPRVVLRVAVAVAVAVVVAARVVVVVGRRVRARVSRVVVVARAPTRATRGRDREERRAIARETVGAIDARATVVVAIARVAPCGRRRRRASARRVSRAF